MKSRKTVAKNLIFALALGSLSFTGLGTNTAKAAMPALEFNVTSGIITSKTADAKLVWGVAKKLKSSPKAGKAKATQRKLGDVWYEVKNIEDVFGAQIDVSAVARGKAVNIVVIDKTKENDQELKAADFKLLEIKAPDKNFKVVYSADGKGLTKTDNLIVGEDTSGYLAFFKSNAGGKSEQFLPSGDDVQLKKGKNGTWKDLKTYFEGSAFTDAKGDDRVESLTQNGSELYFRLKPAADTLTWASKESKVKVTKRPNAPKIKVDVKKDTVSLKKGMKYKVLLGTVAKSELEVTDPKKNSFKTLMVTDAITDGDKDKKQVLEVFTLGKGKKLSSNVARVELKRQDAPFVGPDAKTGNDLKKQGGVIVDDNKAADGNKLVSFNLAVPYDPTKGAVLENFDTTKDYEFFVDWDGSATKTKWIPLKKAKDADKPTKVKIKTSTAKKEGTLNPSGASSASTISIRVAGDSKSSADVITIGSAPLKINLKLEKLVQEIKKKSGDETNPQAVAPFNAEFKSGTDYSFTVHVKDLVNKEAKPKLINVSKIDGVSVKADAFDGSTADTGSVSTVNIKVAENKQASIEGKKLTFEFVVEGVKEKFDITLKK